MSGNTLGRLFRVTTFGESHGPALGAIVDGCPPGLALSEADLQPDLDRRRPGRNRLMSARAEEDKVKILSGVTDGLTTGTPIALVIESTDQRPKAYDGMAALFRPSHADFTYQAKYGHRARSGGGRASARETAARVAAGGIAKKLLAERLGVTIVGWVDRVGDVAARVDPEVVRPEDVAAFDVQCPDPAAAAAMTELIEAVKKDGDTIGGVIAAVARGVPAGWGDPVFDKLEALLARAMLSLPAAKGFESGSGFGGAGWRGSAHNDPFHLAPRADGAPPGSRPGGPGGDETRADGESVLARVRTRTNHSGGIQGGISNGMPVTVRVAFKPVATHFHPQETVDEAGQPATLEAKGRHDPCVLPRAVVIVEAMMALVLCDAWLRHRGQTGRDGVSG
ncbi:MAG: chorismate synthase [Deltaproteobacteria bacterium]|nr:chorismate synthase [Deltaproteobacteria bacterium]